MEKNRQFEVVNLAEVLRRARPIEDIEPDMTAATRILKWPAPREAAHEEIRGQVVASRVFVINEEKFVADTLVAILKNSGYEATAFYDGKSALAAGETGYPDCIIADLELHGMSATELVEQIGNDWPTCTLLLFSSPAATADIPRAEKLKRHDFEVLLKPVHPKDLLARLELSRQRPQ